MVDTRAALEAAGAQVAFVHMSLPEEADRWFAHYGATTLARVSDPERQLYRQFGLESAALGALVHPRVWWPWVRTAVFRRHGFGQPGQHWRQLTGAFVVHRGRLLASVRHRNSAERADYVALVRGLRLI